MLYAKGKGKKIKGDVLTQTLITGKSIKRKKKSKLL